MTNAVASVKSCSRNACVLQRKGSLRIVVVFRLGVLGDGHPSSLRRGL
jgi:hypothetical protein